MEKLNTIEITLTLLVQHLDQCPFWEHSLLGYIRGLSRSFYSHFKTGNNLYFFVANAIVYADQIG